MKAKVNEVVTKVQAMLGDGYKVSAIDSFKNARSGKDVGFTIHKDGKTYAPVLYLLVSDIAEGNTDELAGRNVRDFKRVKVDKSILLNSFDMITISSKPIVSYSFKSGYRFIARWDCHSCINI